jgi:hypothetical protein
VRTPDLQVCRRQQDRKESNVSIYVNGVEFNPADYEGLVEVTDDGNGTLTATVTEKGAKVFQAQVIEEVRALLKAQVADQTAT